MVAGEREPERVVVEFRGPEGVSEEKRGKAGVEWGSVKLVESILSVDEIGSWKWVRFRRLPCRDGSLLESVEVRGDKLGNRRGRQCGQRRVDVVVLSWVGNG
jgi:hypothetical protein